MESNNVLFAGDLAKHLLESDNPMIAEIGKAIEQDRIKLITNLENNSLEAENQYWLSHKVVISIDTDWDFYFLGEDGEMTNNDTLEWTGDSRQAAIQKARDYLTNKDNYTGSEQRVSHFISNYINVSLDSIAESSNTWSCGGNWEVELEYHEPDPETANEKVITPSIDIYGKKALLLTKDESEKFEFVYPQ